MSQPTPPLPIAFASPDRGRGPSAGPGGPRSLLFLRLMFPPSFAKVQEACPPARARSRGEMAAGGGYFPTVSEPVCPGSADGLEDRPNSFLDRRSRMRQISSEPWPCAQRFSVILGSSGAPRASGRRLFGPCALLHPPPGLSASCSSAQAACVGYRFALAELLRAVEAAHVDGCDR